MNLKEARIHFCNELSDLYENSELNTMYEWCIEEFCKKTKIQQIGNPHYQLSNEELTKLQSAITQLLKHKPIQYVLGHAWFYEWDFKVSPAVLIPRPETEELVQHVIQQCNVPNTKIFEVGTGSGCIAISLDKKLINSQVTACDISPAALEIAKSNANTLHSSVSFIELDICQWEQLTKNDLQLDCVISNPPYICEHEKSLMRNNVLEHEPYNALFVPDNDPLLFYRHIAKFAYRHLKDNALLAVEINERYGNETAELFTKSGFKNTTIINDLFGKPRIVTARKQSN